MSTSRSKTESLIVEGRFDPAKVEAAVRDWIAANAGPHDTVHISPVEPGHDFSTVLLTVETPGENTAIEGQVSPELRIEELEVEVRRLRGLFNEVDALRCEAVARHYESGDCGDLPDAEFVFPYRDLAARIRRAIGEPEQRQPRPGLWPEGVPGQVMKTDAIEPHREEMI